MSLSKHETEKMFQTKAADLNEICNLFYVKMFCMMQCVVLFLQKIESVNEKA